MKMLDFADVSVIDNHCHPIEPEKAVMDPEMLAREFFHGMGDIPDPGIKKAKLWGATQELRYHFLHMRVVHTMVCQLSKVLGCPAELEAVTSERNRRTAESFAAYARLLYDDAGIVGTVLDTGLHKDDPILELIPGKVMRLFQMEPLLRKLLEQSGSYQELLRGYQETLDRAVRDDGCIGVKSHLAEQVGFGVEPVSEAEAEAIFPSAKTGDSEAFKKLYVSIFTATLLQCQDLGVPVHLHSGFTGGLWNGSISNADPFLLVHLLRQPEFLQTRIVLLHGGYPWIQHAAAVAHALPHVWVDMGWMTPWISLRIVECYRDVIAMAPLSKLMIGSGGHGTPEIAWLAAKTAKIALAKALGDAVKLDLMASKQAEKAGRMILHDNAVRMYGLGK
ncbi:MAG: amidohydrolase family protein [Deltaproteobacteria bacterium]|nr:amidohydrolase family protein [Deltaproteobacteria bacterium]